MVMVLVVLSVGLLIGYVIVKYLDSCPHSWKLIKDGEIKNYNSRGEEITKGFVKIYECQHCKKLKSEKIMI